jgi:hypothetical protein
MEPTVEKHTQKTRLDMCRPVLAELLQLSKESVVNSKGMNVVKQEVSVVPPE